MTAPDWLRRNAPTAVSLAYSVPCLLFWTAVLVLACFAPGLRKGARS